MTVRLGVVGLGGMGEHHARTLRDLDCDLVAGADVLAEARASFAEAFDVATYDDHEAMYDDADLDGVVVTTPNAFHEPVVTAALERDLATLCEKPLADSLAGAESIVEAHRESEAFCMVGFHNRFSTAGAVLADYRECGRLGEVTHVEADYVRRRGIPGVGSWFTDRELSGGGALIDIGVHLIDFALYLAGFPTVEEVSGTTRSEFGAREEYADPDDWAGNWDTSEGTFDVEDAASAFLRCADGTTMSLEVAWAANREPSNEVVVRGTEAGARCTVGGDSATLYSCETGGADHYVDSELAGDLDPSGHAAEDARFVEAVRSGEAPAINTVEEGLAVQRVVDGIYRSSDAGEAVRL
ncbi:MAG: Gfo/Idh/MocA family protein [Halanaeroarchaeum sp.]